MISGSNTPFEEIVRAYGENFLRTGRLADWQTGRQTPHKKLGRVGKLLAMRWLARGGFILYTLKAWIWLRSKSDCF